jgi:hypothetical protein
LPDWTLRKMQLPGGCPTMTSENEDSVREELFKIDGALDVLFELREQFAQWAEEAEDDSKQEALENVLGHVEAVEAEYKQRREAAQARSDSGDANA